MNWDRIWIYPIWRKLIRIYSGFDFWSWILHSLRGKKHEKKYIITTGEIIYFIVLYLIPVSEWNEKWYCRSYSYLLSHFVRDVLVPYFTTSSGPNWSASGFLVYMPCIALTDWHSQLADHKGKGIDFFPDYVFSITKNIYFILLFTV